MFLSLIATVIFLYAFLARGTSSVDQHQVAVLAGNNLTAVPLSEDVQNAIKFEASNRAHGSIYTDPFYQAPPGTADVAPGTLLKVEEVTNTSLYTLPPGLALSRYVYQSETSTGRKVPVSAFILWPYTQQSHAGGVPVVVWSHGTSGISTQCAPSNIRNLWHHFQAPFALAEAGYAVVASDYAGLGIDTNANGEFIMHEYLTGPAQANDILYSIPAARSAFPQLSREFVLVGHSQGGGAVWSAAQKMAKEPMQGYLGAVALAPTTKVLELPETEPILPALLIMMTPSLEIKYPGFRGSDILDSQGLQSLEAYQNVQGCNSVLFNLPVGHDILKPGWKDNAYLKQFQADTYNGGKLVAGPMLILQGGADSVVNAGVVTESVNQTAAVNPEVSLEYHLLPGITHGGVQHAGLRIHLPWIAARFADVPTSPGLKNNTAEPVRPVAAYRPDTNFYLALETAPWQQT